MSLTSPSSSMGNVSHTRDRSTLRASTSTLRPILRKTSKHSSQASASSSQRNLSLSPSPTKSINLHDFKCVAFVGEGSFGTVHCLEHKSSGLRAALKTMKKYPKLSPRFLDVLPEEVREHEENQFREKCWTSAVNESLALQKLHGQKHVLQLRGAYQDADNFYLLTDFYPGRDLEGMLSYQEDGVFGFEAVQFYLADMLLGLKAIHDHAIFHGDIKIKNILVGANGHAVIADFGLTHIFQGGKGPAQRSVDEHIHEIEGGTIENFAPEVLETVAEIPGESYGYPADIWALGLVVYELLVGKHPFWDIPDNMLYRHVTETGIQFKVEDVQELDLNFQSVDFVGNACHRDQYERHTAEQLMRTAMFDGFDWAAHMAGTTEAPGIPPEDFFPESKDKRPPVEIFSTDIVQTTEHDTLDFDFKSPDFFESFVSSADSLILTVEDTAEMDEKDGDITITVSYSEPFLLYSPPPSPLLPSPPPPSPREPTPEPEMTLVTLPVVIPTEKYNPQSEGLFSKVKDLGSSVWGRVTRVAESREQSITLESMNDITLGPSPSEHKSVFSASSSSSCLPPPCFLSGLSRDMVPGLGQSVWSPHQVHSTTSLATDSFYNPLTKPNLPSLQSIPRSIYGFPRSVIPGLDFSIWSPRLPATESKIPRTPITFLAPPELSEFESQLPATPSYSALGLAITSALTRCRQEVPSFPSVSNLPAPPTSIPQQFLRIPFASFVKALMERQLWFCQHFSSRMAFL